MRQAAKTALGTAAVNDDTLTAIIRDVILDGFAAGGHAAAEQVGGGAVTIAGVSDVNWGAWKPGDARAAGLVQDSGLARLLDTAGVTVRGATETLIDQIGNAIANGLRAGNSVQTVSRDLRGIIGSTARAERIAHTETARAMTAATMQTYGLNGIGQWDLVTSDGACPQCEAIAAANPHPVGDVGDQAPVHPLCRCAASPVVPTA